VSGAAALMAAACGGGNDTPTPVRSPLYSPLTTPRPGVNGYQTYLPFVASDGAPEAALVEPTLTPTPSKTPEPTDTPEPPTATPTPQATPFPPGPPSKLGLFVGRNDPTLFDLLKTQAVTVVKTLELDSNFVAQIKHTSPNTKVIGRIALEQVNLATVDPLAEARRFVDLVLPYADDPGRRPYFDGWESFNEPVAGNYDEMARLGEFEAETHAPAGRSRHPQRDRQLRHRAAAVGAVACLLARDPGRDPIRRLARSARILGANDVLPVDGGG
jgi:hypothetical protein